MGREKEIKVCMCLFCMMKQSIWAESHVLSSITGDLKPKIKVSGRLTSEGREKNLSHASHLASGCFLAIIHIV